MLTCGSRTIRTYYIDTVIMVELKHTLSSDGLTREQHQQSSFPGNGPCHCNSRGVTEHSNIHPGHIVITN